MWLGRHSIGMFVRLNAGHGLEVKLGICIYDGKPGSFAVLKNADFSFLSSWIDLYYQYSFLFESIF